LTSAVRLTTGSNIDAIIGLGLGCSRETGIDSTFVSVDIFVGLTVVVGVGEGTGLAWVLGRGPNDARYERVSLREGLARKMERIKSCRQPCQLEKCDEARHCTLSEGLGSSPPSGCGSRRPRIVYNADRLNVNNDSGIKWDLPH